MKIPYFIKNLTGFLAVFITMLPGINTFGSLAFASLNDSTNSSPGASSFVEGLSIPEYGDLYVMESQDQKVFPWRGAVSYGLEFGNPYSEVHGMTVTAEHSWGRFVWLGVQATRYASSPTSLMKTLEKEMESSGWRYSVQSPRFSIYPVLTLVPMNGYLNLFGRKAIEAELDIRIGYGQINYGDLGGKGALLWSIRPMTYVTQNTGIQMGVGQEVESILDGENRIVRFRGEVGVSYRF